MQQPPKRYQRHGLRTRALSITLPLRVLRVVERAAREDNTSLSAIVVRALIAHFRIPRDPEEEAA